MATARHADRRTRTARPWWRPAAYSAAATAAIAALFNPVPAFADPGSPELPTAPVAVPDIGSRPMALGTLVMPGQTPSATPTASPTIPGASTSPVLQQIEKGRTEIATMGDQLIEIGQDRDLAHTQQGTAEQKYEQAVALLQEARSEAANAAARAMIEAAARPPGSFDSGLAGLDDLARLQRGQGDTSQAAARQLETAETSVQLAIDENTLATQHYDELVGKYNTLNTQLSKKQAAQQALELKHAGELSAAEASENAADSALGAQYLAGAEAGRGADPRALQALQFALAQRGDPYVWSEEGPNAYDCSGLMWAAYRSAGFTLERVSRDQYWQTHLKVVDRYSLLPGDLLFFSSSNSWRGIHHVAMYAGNGLMVEAPRTGLNVRLVPVRWTRLFQATRVFGSVPGVTEGPELGTPDPENEPTTPDNTTPSSPRPSATTTNPSSQPTSPSTSPSGTRPTTTPPTTTPTTTPPTTTPTTTPPTTTPPTTPPTTTPATTPPATTPSGGSTSTESPSGGSTSGGSTGGSTGSTTTPATGSTSSATATEEATQSASASSGSTSSSSGSAPASSGSASSSAG